VSLRTHLLSWSAKPINVIIAVTAALLLAAVLSLFMWFLNRSGTVLTLAQLFLSLAAVIAGVPLVLALAMWVVRAALRG
jgi:hypothetical protein